jgi:glycerol-3-phosphate dehydrogenase
VTAVPTPSTGTIECQLLVIGGGSTGVGAAWDAALRGLRVVLAERGDLATGTTGRFHGLLHSGARYVVGDPAAARQCARENEILRQVATATIEDTGGLFVSTPEDDPEYADRFLAGCHRAGVPVEEISVSQALRREARLNPRVRRAFSVRDGSIDSWKLVWACAKGAELRGARILTYHPVIALLREGDRVIGARLHDLRAHRDVEVRAQCVINAAGVWSGHVAQLAGCDVGVQPGKGVMVAVNHRLANSVISRCNMPGDGDILVPSHSVSVIGTTDTPVTDPDDTEPTAEEVAKMMAAGDVLIPGFSQTRVLRVWAGARPLLPQNGGRTGEDRDITRSYTVIRHAQRDGIAGLISVTGGKLTTYRLMAEDAVDAACAELGVVRPCTTAESPLPGSAEPHHYRLSDHQREFERRIDGPTVCECELVSSSELVTAVRDHPQADIDDLRRLLRIGMGPCQGGFCTFRAAGILHGCGEYDRHRANSALRRFVEERWRGQRPALWGQQLRQARLDAWIFQGVLDVEHLPE